MLAYDFSGENGKFTFSAENLTNQGILLDFSESSLVVNGENRPYFQNKTLTAHKFQTQGSTTEIFDFSSSKGNINGISVSQSDLTRIYLAPGAHMEFRQAFTLSLPDQALVPVRRNQSIPLETSNPVFDYHFQHFLSYRLQDQPAQVYTVNDLFGVSASRVVGDKAYLSELQELTPHQAKLRTFRYLYRVDEKDQESKVGTLIGVGSAFVLILWLASLEE